MTHDFGQPEEVRNYSNVNERQGIRGVWGLILKGLRSRFHAVHVLDQRTVFNKKDFDDAGIGFLS